MSEIFVTTIQKPEGPCAILISEKHLFRFSVDVQDRSNNLSFEDLNDFFEFVELPLSTDFLRTKYFNEPHSLQDPHNGKYPKAFKLFLFPFLQNATQSQMNQYVHFYWALDLANNTSLLAGISRMASSRDHEKTLSWCNVLQYQQPNRRSLFVTLLMKSGVFESFCGNAHFPLWEKMLEITGRKNYPLRLWTLFDAVKRKVEVEYILAGLQFASLHLVIQKIQPCDDLPLNVIRSLDRYVSTAKNYCPLFAYDLWYVCGSLKGFGRLLRCFSDFKQFTPDECFEFFDIFCELGTDKQTISHTSNWQKVKCYAPALWRILQSVKPDCRVKFIENVHSLFRFGLSYAAKHLASTVTLLFRLASDPRFLQIDDWFASIGSRLLDNAGKYNFALLFAPLGSWFQLERACDDRSNRDVEEGLIRMLRVIPLFTAKAFWYFPQKLFQIADRLAMLPEGTDRKILAVFKRSPLYCERFKRKSDAEIVEYFAACRLFSNPVPKVFQKYAGVPGALSKGRRKRYRKIFYQNLHLTRLEALDHCITSHLCELWQPDASINDDLMHSILMLSGRVRNHRIARRFLKAYLRGKTDYILQHPLTVEWMQKHESWNLSLWLKGIDWEVETEAFGVLRIRVEQDPLQAWKLGTYVGSCLSVGGTNREYASAAVLDLNKRVVYARNSKSQVIARQLLALSEEGTLVCFSVYPLKIGREVQLLFRKYDRTFATALGIPLHDPRDRYTIATILARDWYDDSVWTFAK